jgi:hypothetical protein
VPWHLRRRFSHCSLLARYLNGHSLRHLRWHFGYVSAEMRDISPPLNYRKETPMLLQAIPSTTVTTPDAQLRILITAVLRASEAFILESPTTPKTLLMLRCACLDFLEAQRPKAQPARRVGGKL